MRYRSAPERRARMLQLVEDQGFCSTSELVIALGVSDMTVRRDAQRMAEAGLVRIVHGGISVLPASALEGSGDFAVRTPRMATAKQAVGRRAAELVKSGDTIAVDAGTTLSAFASCLPSDMAFTVVTHSAPVIVEMLSRPIVKVVVLGGELHHETQSFSGDATLTALENLHVETLFLAASGVSTRGIFCANDFDAVTKRALIAIADTVVLVVDSSKFTSTAMVRICGLDAVDRVVVDDQIRVDDLRLLSENEVDVVPAPVGNPIPAL